MKKLIIFSVFANIVYAANCPDLNGEWRGICDLDGKVEDKVLRIRQDSCEHINFYGIDYRIGLPYTNQYENNFEHTMNVYNLFWHQEGSGLTFNVDRIKWMKYRSEVSNGEGRGRLFVKDGVMSYHRTYSARSRDGVYSKSIRRCEFTKN